MAIPIAAVIKKVAVKFLMSDKETKKNYGALIATAVGVLLFPLIAVGAVFSGVSADSWTTNAQNKFSLVAGNSVSHLLGTQGEIKSTMESSGFSSLKIKEATTIYTLFFTNDIADSSFVSRFVSCFNEEQTAEELTSSLNSTFGKEISASKIRAIMLKLSSTYINPNVFLDTTTKNNLDLVIWCQEAVAKEWGYVWGTSGGILKKETLESLAELYPNNVGDEDHYDYIKDNYIGKRTADCAGLIKSYMWYDFETGTIIYSGFDFADGNTEDIFSRTIENGTMDTMPDIPGIGLYHEGHMGVYIGDGLVIEAMGTKYGVVQSNLSDGSWTNWFKIPGLDYIEETEIIQETEEGEEVTADG